MLYYSKFICRMAYDTKEAVYMKHIKTLTTRDLKESMKKGGCGECQTSCQSACKTSCTVGNQSCEKLK
jgi:predicted ribosomally synthesized six-cysteine peptide SCIFF